MPFLRGLDIPGDLALSDDGRELAVLTGAGRVAQSIQTRAQILKGSWRYDLNVGVPYLQELFVQGPQMELSRRRFYELIRQTPGVTAVTGLTLRFDSTSATLYVDFVCTTDEGDTVSGTLDFVAAV